MGRQDGADWVVVVVVVVVETVVVQTVAEAAGAVGAWLVEKIVAVASVAVQPQMPENTTADVPQPVSTTAAARPRVEVRLVDHPYF